MSTVGYRDAVADDAAALSAFWRDQFVATFGHLYPPEDLAAFLADKYQPHRQRAEIEAAGSWDRLAFLEGRLAGAARLGPLGLPVAHPPAGALELQRLYLAQKVQGAGVGDTLMAWAIATARTGGATGLYLSVWSENHRAQRFYARHGFAQVGRYGFPVGQTIDDEWILHRPL